ncbi:putative leader peptide [Streptomyces sp. GESEQ-35]|nr:putative leader peptide [Streptomyces sp. GESEQ-35]
MARLDSVTGPVCRTRAQSPLLTSRRHIDLLRVCSAIGLLG